METKSGLIVKMPAIFGRIERFKDSIIETINDSSEKFLAENWKEKVDKKNRLLQWCVLCSKNYSEDETERNIAYSVLTRIFSL